jgi:hypothetical protein
MWSFRVGQIGHKKVQKARNYAEKSPIRKNPCYPSLIGFYPNRAGIARLRVELEADDAGAGGEIVG